MDWITKEWSDSMKVSELITNRIPLVNKLSLLILLGESGKRVPNSSIKSNNQQALELLDATLKQEDVEYILRNVEGDNTRIHHLVGAYRIRKAHPNAPQEDFEKMLPIGCVLDSKNYYCVMDLDKELTTLGLGRKLIFNILKHEKEDLVKAFVRLVKCKPEMIDKRRSTVKFKTIDFSKETEEFLITFCNAHLNEPVKNIMNCIWMLNNDLRLIRYEGVYFETLNKYPQLAYLDIVKFCDDHLTCTTGIVEEFLNFNECLTGVKLSIDEYFHFYHLTSECMEGAVENIAKVVIFYTLPLLKMGYNEEFIKQFLKRTAPALLSEVRRLKLSGGESLDNLVTLFYQKLANSVLGLNYEKMYLELVDKFGSDKTSNIFELAMKMKLRGVDIQTVTELCKDKDKDILLDLVENCSEKLLHHLAKSGIFTWREQLKHLFKVEDGEILNLEEEEFYWKLISKYIEYGDYDYYKALLNLAYKLNIDKCLLIRLLNKPSNKNTTSFVTFLPTLGLTTNEINDAIIELLVI